MSNKLQRIVERLGFTNKEALVYLACLELDGSPNTQIAKKTKLNRITNYEILKRLEKRGVVASYKRLNIKHFAAINPRIVIRQVKEHIAVAEEQLPELLSIANKNEKKPRIYFFDGIDGIKSIYEDSLTSSGEILTFTNVQDIEDLLGKIYIERYLSERVKRKISVRGLAPYTLAGKHAQDVGSELLREARLFDTRHYTINNEIMIYDNKIALFSGKDRVGLIIQNDELAETFKSIWNMAWKQAENEMLKP